MIDKNGMEIEISDEVEVPSPSEFGNDQWDNEFVGTVLEMNEEDGLIIVVDQEGESKTIEPNRVEIV